MFLYVQSAADLLGMPDLPNPEFFQYLLLFLVICYALHDPCKRLLDRWFRKK